MHSFSAGKYSLKHTSVGVRCDDERVPAGSISAHACTARVMLASMKSWLDGATLEKSQVSLPPARTCLYPYIRSCALPCITFSKLTTCITSYKQFHTCIQVILGMHTYTCTYKRYFHMCSRTSTHKYGPYMHTKTLHNTHQNVHEIAYINIFM